MARILPGAAAREAASADDGEVECTLLLYRLWLASSRAALPLLPITQELHLLVQPSLFDHRAQLRPRQPVPQRFDAIGNAPGCKGGNRGVQFQFALVHFIEG